MNNKKPESRRQMTAFRILNFSLTFIPLENPC